jgi:hypothetical protein
MNRTRTLLSSVLAPVLALAACGEESSSGPRHEGKSDAFGPDAVTVELTGPERAAAIALFNRLAVPPIGDGICQSQSVTVSASVRDFNPAVWTASYDDGARPIEAPLTDGEIAEAIALFDRVGVPAVHVDPITLVSTASIRSSVCGFRPRFSASTWAAATTNARKENVPIGHTTAAK